MDPIAIASLLKEYGMVGALALTLGGAAVLVVWLKDSWQARIDDKATMVERYATALERSTATAADQTESIKELRDGQAAILKTTTEGALTGAASDRAILKEIEECRAAVDRNVGARS